MTIYSKIAKIQDQVQNIVKDGRNPHFSNTYATYEQVMGVLHPLLREHNLMICHSFAPPTEHANLLGVTTRIVELTADDSEVATTLYIPMTKNDPQMAGSAVTYAKRYSVLAMFGLGTEDDDGNSATPQATTTQNQSTAPKPSSSTPNTQMPDQTPEQIIEKYGLTDMQALQVQTPCSGCGGQNVYNPKTTKIFCKAKCWLK